MISKLFKKSTTTSEKSCSRDGVVPLPPVKLNKSHGEYGSGSSRLSGTGSLLAMPPHRTILRRHTRQLTIGAHSAIDSSIKTPPSSSSSSSSSSRSLLLLRPLPVKSLSSSQIDGGLCCDKCDGKHQTGKLDTFLSRNFPTSFTHQYIYIYLPAQLIVCIVIFVIISLYRCLSIL
jgi:hypothetical protein